MSASSPRVQKRSAMARASGPPSNSKPASTSSSFSEAAVEARRDARLPRKGRKRSWLVAAAVLVATAALGAIARYGITHSQWVPTMFVRMLKLDPAVRAKYDVSSMQVAIHAAAPCPIPVKEQMIEWWGPIIHEYYAGTEGNGFVYCNSDMWLAHEGTVGTPINCIVQIGRAHV